jgi:hypothetical protein
VLGLGVNERINVAVLGVVDGPGDCWHTRGRP